MEIGKKISSKRILNARTAISMIAIIIVIVIIIAAVGGAVYYFSTVSKTTSTPTTSHSTVSSGTATSVTGTTSRSTSAVSSTFSSSATALSLYGNVTGTIMIYNNTVVPGSASPPTAFETQHVFDEVYDPANGYIYATVDPQVTNALFPGDVLAINGNTGKIVANITLPLGAGPEGVAYDSQNGYLYIADTEGNGISVINTANNTLLSTGAPSITQSTLVMYDPDNNNLYATSLSSDNTLYIAVLNPSTLSIIGSISLSNVSTGVDSIVYDQSNKMIYVANSPINGQGNVTVINAQTNSFVTNIPVGVSPEGAALDPSNGRLYVANYDSANVSVIDTTSNTVVGNISIPGFGNAPSYVVFDPHNGYVYVTEGSYGSISVINPNSSSVVGSVNSSAGGADHIVFDASNHDLYVTSFVSGVIYIVETP